MGRTANDSEGEMNSTEESIAGAAAIHLWLIQPRFSPVADMDIASNETLAYPETHEPTVPLMRIKLQLHGKEYVVDDKSWLE